MHLKISKKDILPPQLCVQEPWRTILEDVDAVCDVDYLRGDGPLFEWVHDEAGLQYHVDKEDGIDEASYDKPRVCPRAAIGWLDKRRFKRSRDRREKKGDRRREVPPWQDG